MLKPKLQIALHQLEPLPSAASTARKIQESFRFIEENRRITVRELPMKWAKFWSVGGEDQLENLAEYPITDETNCAPGLLTSFAIFGYAYVKYYREEDFADFHNYLNMYADFQKILLILSTLETRKRTILPAYRLFDLGNLSIILDELTALERAQ